MTKEDKTFPQSVVFKIEPLTLEELERNEKGVAEFILLQEEATPENIQRNIELFEILISGD